MPAKSPMQLHQDAVTFAMLIRAHCITTGLSRSPRTADTPFHALPPDSQHKWLHVGIAVLDELQRQRCAYVSSDLTGLHNAILEQELP